MNPRKGTVPFFLLLVGCAQIPDSFVPPVQRKPLDTVDPLPVKHFVNMGDPNAAAHFIGDISDALEGGSWRWVRKRPTLRFGLDSTVGIKLKVDLTVPGQILKETGPMTISFQVNGRLLEKIRYDKEGTYEFLKPVEPGWLKKGAENVVTLEADKVWVSPSDGAVLAFILMRAGFVQ